jgi:hypothetical protein
MGTLSFTNNIASKSDAEQKLLKHDAIYDARNQITTMAKNMANAAPEEFRRMIVRNKAFAASVVILWFLGFWPLQIAEFIGTPCTEEIVLGTLRRLFVVEQERIITTITNLLQAGDL